MAHINKPECLSCIAIINKYPNPHPELAKWGLELRARFPEAHISACGRGKADQELFFSRGTSRAHYGQSSHNYNAALDFFRLTQSGGASFDSNWYKAVLGPAALALPWLRWYGVLEGKNDFLEYPHVEVRAWRELVQANSLHLVEPA